MEVFLGLVQRLVPLILLVAAGYIAGRRLEVQRESIAKLLIYLVSPVVVFTNVSQVHLEPEYLAVPFLFFGLCSLLAWGFLQIGGRLWPEGPTKNLVAFAAGNANTGYFGLPVAMMLFGPESSGMLILFCLGFILYENSYGFYLMARGRHTAREAFVRFLRLPTIYAFSAAILANWAGLRIEGVYADFSSFFRGTYSVLGMMMVGLGVSEIRSLRLDGKLLGTLFTAKFAVWPALVLALVYLDRAYLHVYDDRAHQIMILLSACPLAANTVAFAALLKVEPEKAGMATLASTLFALLYIPFIVGAFLR